MPNERPVGIDLGTTFSAAAWVNEQGQTNVIRNGEGDLLTPSVVLFDDKEVAVGKEARMATMVQPELVAQWVKRDMGLPYYTRAIRGQRIPPEVIQACILRKLKRDIVDAIGEVGRVVITVPAYFDEPRRKGTADAGEMAGLNVLDIVNEPTAAALSFGEILGYLTPGGGPKEAMTLLVYDLGGGTFDVTLLQLAPGVIQTIATDGDVLLGGHDWDMRLAEHVAKAFQQAYGIDPRDDAATMNRVLAAVIDAKHALSARSRAMVRVDMAGHSLEVPITRTQFQEMTADLLERTSYTTRQLLATAQRTWKDVSRVLLVGGSTRMPMVVEMLRKLSGIEPDHTVNPDEAVARGAALYASYLLGKETGAGRHANLAITNVNSHSLGVEGIEQETLRKINVVLLSRNTALPARLTKKFATKIENQRSIVIRILEGESSLPGECTPIGRTVIHDLPDGLPKNWPVDITFEYGANGRLTVDASVPGTRQGARLQLERASGMSNENVKAWKGPVVAAAGFNAFEAMVEDVLERSHEAIPEAIAIQSANSSISRGWTVLDIEPPTPASVKTTPARTTVSPSGAMDADNAKVPCSITNTAVPAEFAGQSAMEGFLGDARNNNMPTRPDFSAAPPQISEVVPPPKATDAAYQFPFPRWLFSMIGHVVAAVVGLALGYLILSWLRPATFQLPW